MPQTLFARPEAAVNHISGHISNQLSLLFPTGSGSTYPREHTG